MRRLSLLATVLILAAALTPLPGGAQIQDDFERYIGLEGRAGATLPAGDLKDIAATASIAITLNLLYNITPQWAGYVGWGFHDFGCDGCPDDLGSTVWHAGAQYTFPWRGSALPWVRAALALATLTVFQAGAEVDSGNELGLELGTGVDFRLTDHVSLSPGASLVFYSARGLPEDDLYVSYIVLDMGARYGF